MPKRGGDWLLGVRRWASSLPSVRRAKGSLKNVLRRSEVNTKRRSVNGIAFAVTSSD